MSEEAIFQQLEICQKQRDTAQSQLAALREEMATTNERWSKCLEGAEKKCERQIKRNSKLVGQRNSMQLKRDEARQRLADAELRNSELEWLLRDIYNQNELSAFDDQRIDAALNPKPEAASHDE